MAFRKAERKSLKARIALAGPAGSGKTLSALRLAKGMSEALGGLAIGLIDTEKESSGLYAFPPGGKKKGHILLPDGWQVNFDVLPFNPPFEPRKYVRGIQTAQAEGIQILIIDSLSHEWFGEGGILEMVDHFAKSFKNQFAAWKVPTQEHNKMVEAILQSPMHIIATMRSKVAWEVVKDESTGKTVPKKLGLQAVQREGLDFEFTTWLDLAVDGHVATASKDRTGLFDGVSMVITEETGRLLVDWLNES